MKTVAIVSALILAAFIASAKNNEPNSNKPEEANSLIVGHVGDIYTGEELLYATVALYKTDNTLVKGAITNKEGNFFINGLAIGDYVLRVSYLGYEPSKDIAFSVDSGNKKLRVRNVQLTPKTYHLNEVYVCAGVKSDVEETKVTASASKIEQKMILANSLNW